MFNARLGCSSISFRHQGLSLALQTMAEIGFTEIDLGALPGVCDHVPFDLDTKAVAEVSAIIKRSKLRVRSVNGDIGDLNRPLDESQHAERDSHLNMLLTLAAATGARALVLPCGALETEPIQGLDKDLDMVASELVRAARAAEDLGIEIWTESLHFFRLCCNMQRAEQLTSRLAPSDVRVVMDFSHIVASGGNPADFVDRFHHRIAHVHLRDAIPGNINLSIGNGRVNFAAGLLKLREMGYSGHFSLELETRDISNEERPDAAAKAAEFISSII